MIGQSLEGRVVGASRFANPFATCWTRPGALAWVGEGPQSLERLTERLLQFGAGQIVGPHGVGKSSLMSSLAERLTERGAVIHRWRGDGGVDAPRDGDDWLLVDGAEQLAWAERRRLLRQARHGERRLLATTHRRLHLPVLAKLCPSADAFSRLFLSLTSDRPTPVCLEDAQRCYERYQPNVREVWFALYDLHHRLTHAS